MGNCALSISVSLSWVSCINFGELLMLHTGRQWSIVTVVILHCGMGLSEKDGKKSSCWNYQLNYCQTNLLRWGSPLGSSHSSNISARETSIRSIFSHTYCPIPFFGPRGSVSSVILEAIGRMGVVSWQEGLFLVRLVAPASCFPQLICMQPNPLCFAHFLVSLSGEPADF